VIAMLKSLASASALALLLAACAAMPPSTPEKTAAAAALPLGCVGQTATRLPVKDDTCAGFGSTYSQQDIYNTGQTDAGKALAQMDPSVRVGH
jgi:PBP1b-binding outer membrane lipoprotein LpoB